MAVESRLRMRMAKARLAGARGSDGSKRWFLTVMCTTAFWANAGPPAVSTAPNTIAATARLLATKTIGSSPQGITTRLRRIFPHAGQSAMDAGTLELVRKLQLDTMAREVGKIERAGPADLVARDLGIPGGGHEGFPGE